MTDGSESKRPIALGVATLKRDILTRLAEGPVFGGGSDRGRPEPRAIVAGLMELVPGTGLVPGHKARGRHR